MRTNLKTIHQEAEYKGHLLKASIKQVDFKGLRIKGFKRLEDDDYNLTLMGNLYMDNKKVARAIFDNETKALTFTLTNTDKAQALDDRLLEIKLENRQFFKHNERIIEMLLKQQLFKKKHKNTRHNGAYYYYPIDLELSQLDLQYLGYGYTQDTTVDNLVEKYADAKHWASITTNKNRKAHINHAYVFVQSSDKNYELYKISE